MGLAVRSLERTAIGRPEVCSPILNMGYGLAPSTPATTTKRRGRRAPLAIAVVLLTILAGAGLVYIWFLANEPLSCSLHSSTVSGSAAVPSAPHAGADPPPPPIYFVLNWTQYRSAQGCVSYWFKFTYIAPNLTAQDFQFRIVTVNGPPVSVDFTVHVGNAEGSNLATYDSWQSNWTGSGLNASFSTLGGWVAGGSTAMFVNDTVELTGPASVSGDALRIGEYFDGGEETDLPLLAFPHP
jgi:hypothetical protein